MWNDMADNILKDACDFILENEELLDKFIEYVPYFVGESDIRKAAGKVTRSKWKKRVGVVTPGGDPAYECPCCGGGRHLNGIEFREEWDYCPDCGQRLEY